MIPILEYILKKNTKVTNYISLEDFEKTLKSVCDTSDQDNVREIHDTIEELKNQNKQYTEITCGFADSLINKGYQVELGIHRKASLTDESTKIIQIIIPKNGTLYFLFINVEKPMILSLTLSTNNITLYETNIKDKKRFISLAESGKIGDYYDTIFETNNVSEPIEDEIKDYNNILYKHKQYYDYNK